jgi:hypothetical protein
VAGIGLVIFLALVLAHSKGRPDSRGRGSGPQLPVVGGIIRGDPRQVTADPFVPASGDDSGQPATTTAEKEAGR